MGSTAQRGGTPSNEHAGGGSPPLEEARINDAVQWLSPLATESAQSGVAARVLITAFGGEPHRHALNLARAIADTPPDAVANDGISGAVVIRPAPSAILVDTSQGAAALSALLRVARAPGLAELCQYRARFEDVIQRDLGSRLHFLAAGKPRAVGGAWGEPGVADRVFRALDASYRMVLFCAEAAEAVQLAENLRRPFSAAVIVDYTGGREERLVALFESFGFPLLTIREKV